MDTSAATVTVTTGLLDLLDDDEVDAVIAHELGHVINGDMREGPVVDCNQMPSDPVKVELAGDGGPAPTALLDDCCG